jgi:hypothetical protein
MTVAGGILFWTSDTALGSTPLPLSTSVPSAVRVTRPVTRPCDLVYDRTRPGRLLLMDQSGGSRNCKTVEVDVKTGLMVDEPDACRDIDLTGACADACGGLWTLSAGALQRYDWTRRSGALCARLTTTPIHTAGYKDADDAARATTDLYGKTKTICVDPSGQRIFFVEDEAGRHDDRSAVRVIDLRRSGKTGVSTVARGLSAIYGLVFLSSERLLIACERLLMAWDRGPAFQLIVVDLLADEWHVFVDGPQQYRCFYEALRGRIGAHSILCSDVPSGAVRWTFLRCCLSHSFSARTPPGLLLKLSAELLVLVRTSS